jgi:hypothetical protein
VIPARPDYIGTLAALTGRSVEYVTQRMTEQAHEERTGA